MTPGVDDVSVFGSVFPGLSCRTQERGGQPPCYFKAPYFLNKAFPCGLSLRVAQWLGYLHHCRCRCDLCVEMHACVRVLKCRHVFLERYLRGWRNEFYSVFRYTLECIFRSVLDTISFRLWTGNRPLAPARFLFFQCFPAVFPVGFERKNCTAPPWKHLTLVILYSTSIPLMAKHPDDCAQIVTLSSKRETTTANE